MKIYARQISPEYQESPLFLGDEFFPDNIAVCGNRDYHSHKPELFENVQNVLEQGELAEVLEYPKNWADWYKNATQAITEYLPPTNGKKYSTNAIHALRCLIIHVVLAVKKMKYFARFFLSWTVGRGNGLLSGEAVKGIGKRYFTLLTNGARKLCSSLKRNISMKVRNGLYMMNRKPRKPRKILAGILFTVSAGTRSR